MTGQNQINAFGPSSSANLAVALDCQAVLDRTEAEFDKIAGLLVPAADGDTASDATRIQKMRALVGAWRNRANARSGIGLN